MQQPFNKPSLPPSSPPKMSNKSKQMAISRPSPSTTVSTYKVGNKSYEMQNTSRAVQKNTYDGTTTTTRNTQVKKGEEFVDRLSGNNGYREEVRYQTTRRVNDKAQGVTKEYQTEVKFKETTTFHHPNNPNYGYHTSGIVICDNYNDSGDSDYDSGDSDYDSDY